MGEVKEEAKQKVMERRRTRRKQKKRNKGGKIGKTGEERWREGEKDSVTEGGWEKGRESEERKE